MTSEVASVEVNRMTDRKTYLESRFKKWAAALPAEPYPASASP